MSFSMDNGEIRNQDIRTEKVIINDFSQIKDTKKSQQQNNLQNYGSRERLAPNTNQRSYEDLKNEFQKNAARNSVNLLA